MPSKEWMTAGLLLGVLSASGLGQVTRRMSVSNDGGEARGLSGSYSHGVSAHGRYVAFYSTADNLVPGDVNKNYDVFVRDTWTETTVRASVSSAGFGGNAHSSGPVMAADGRHVAFVSEASNLVPGDTNGTWDIFRHDLWTGRTVRVSVGNLGQQGDGSSKDVPALTPDGQQVAFASLSSNLAAGDGAGTWDVFVRDLAGGRTVLVSVALDGGPANGDCLSPSLSADGRFVAFESDATNLVAGDGNGVRDVFVYDRLSGRMELVSRGPLGVLGNQLSMEPTLSADGQTVVFTSLASNLVPGDINGVSDVFVRDLDGAPIQCASLSPLGVPGNNFSGWADLSADGRWVAYASLASDLVPGDTNRTVDVFLYDRVTQRTACRSMGRMGQPANGPSTSPSLSADGRHLSFHSGASNLVENDANRKDDQFLAGPALRFTGQVEPGPGTRPALSLRAWTGRPRGQVAVLLVGVNGEYLPQQLWQGRFDAAGRLRLTWAVPVAWRGTRVTLAVVGEVSSGGFQTTNPVRLILP